MVENGCIMLQSIEADIQDLSILFQAHNTNKSDVKRCVEHLQNIIRELNVVGADHSAFCKGFFSGVCNCFEAFLCSIESELGQRAVLDQTLLQAVVNLASIASKAIQILFQKPEEKENVDVVVNSVSLPVLKTLWLSYQHCKQSQEKYNANFKLAASGLKQLFQESFKLQKLWAAVLSKIKVSSKADAEAAQLVKICSLLLDLCKIVKGIDNMLLVTSWKMLLCFTSKCKAVLNGALDCTSYVEEITGAILTLMEHCHELSANQSKSLLEGNSPAAKSFSDALKLASFLASLLASFCQEYGLASNDTIAVLLMSFVQRVLALLAPMLTVGAGPAPPLPDALRQPCVRHMLESVDKSLAILLSSEAVQNIVLDRDTGHEIGVPDVLLLLRLMRIVGATDKPSLTWYGGARRDSQHRPRSLFTLTFNLLPSVYLDLCKSTQLLIGERQSSLYQQLAGHLCAFALATPAECFGHLEVTMLENLVSSDPYQHLMAFDLWWFVARRAGPLICLRHADLLIQMLKRLPLSRGEELRLGVALKRLVQLLPDHRQVEIARTYPISEDGNLLVWRFLARLFVDATPEPDHQRAVEVLSKTSHAIEAWTKSGRVSQITGLCLHFQTAGSLFSTPGGDKKPDASEARFDETVKGPSFKTQTRKLVTSLVLLWLSLPSACDVPEVLMTLCGAFLRSFASLIATHFDNIERKKIIRKCRELANRHDPNELNENSAACCFYEGLVRTLEALKSVVLPQDVQDDVMLLWRRAILASKAHWHLRWITLSSFWSFSHVTRHPRLVARVCTDVGADERATGCDGTTVAEMVKGHVEQKQIPIASLDNVIKANRDALTRVRPCRCDVTSVPADDVNPAAEASQLLDSIDNAVERLRRLPKENFSPQMILALSRSATQLRELLDN